CTHRVVEVAPAFDADGLGHRHLHALDEVAVPDRLEEGVREAEDEQVLDALLAEIVVDAEDALLGERLVEDVVELLSRRQGAPEWLLDDDSTAVVQADALE